MENVMLHFLSVEDDPTHYQLLWAALLQVKLGVEFDQALQHAPDAHSALVHLGALPEEALPDVIFTDVQMPGMNGWDLAAAPGEPTLSAHPHHRGDRR